MRKRTRKIAVNTAAVAGLFLLAVTNRVFVVFVGLAARFDVVAVAMRLVLCYLLEEQLSVSL